VKPLRSLCISAFLLCVCLRAGAAVESWSHSALPVTNALELWFDASAENAARQSLKLASLNPGSELDRWHDASGHRRDALQRVRESRPRLRRVAGTFFLRFDGESDFLAGSIIPDVSLEEATVFVLAAPRANPGGFRGFLSWNAAGKNDYQSGFNVDLGSRASTNWNFLNMEAAGASGERNLLSRQQPFSQFHVLAISATANFVGVYLDSTAQGTRSRKASPMVLSEFAVGARCNDASGGMPYILSFLDGDVAEVLVYGKALASAERERVEQYLLTKYAGLIRSAADPSQAIETPFVTVTNPPPIQMLVPGFQVRQLPLQLNNVNNLVYSPDGRLFAFGYDGNVFQLKDTDGDGLEDRADYFFRNERNEIPACIGMAWGPGGLYIPAKGRILRLRDKGDGTGELETINSGWVPPSKLGGSSLDAVAITVGSDGAVYFGLGCDDWTGAYRMNKETGKSDYNIQSERGTIIRLSPDFKTREILATGLRWPSSLAFNSAGDLFCTDQEGATWLPNGNPFDELLHIQTGRHYGFPPRHPRYLPRVIDEPSVFDYAPQHESTCGLHFNNGPKLFGPDWWRGDAIIAGESRGKIWRTKLVKTPAGYVGQNQIIACLNMLTIDAVPSPDGDLVVTCHSGLPDWGTGPQGKGKFFKISYVDKSAPQPVLAYAAGPSETRVVFDRPIEPLRFKNLLPQSGMTMGKYVTAGDRFESFRPGYQVVQNQMMEPRFELPLLSAGIASDGRSLTLRTAARSLAAKYAVKLPDSSSMKRDAGRSSLPQQAAVDLLTDLTGVETTWKDSSEQWTGWLPHLDTEVARDLTAASAEHQRLFQLMRNQGTLTMRGQLDVWQMLRTATQPGSTLDYEYPPETVTIVLRSAGGINAIKSGSRARVERPSAREAQITVQTEADHWLPIEISLKTGSAAPVLQVSWHTAEDPRPRALPLRRVLLPWANPYSAESSVVPRSIPEIAGGNGPAGKKLFFGDRAGCYKCHQVNGEGGRIGPDLSNLIHRDYASVMKDITQPSAAINPDHLAYNVQLRDGDILNGIIVADGDKEMDLGSSDGKTIRIAKSKIEAVKPSAISLMPENLLDTLTAQERKDLLTFLLTPSAAPKTAASN